jgi:putative transposase
VSQCCRVLGVSRSGFYAARQRLRQPEQVDPLSVHAKAAFEASGRSYGSRRLSAALRAKGLNVGRYRARQLMRSNALQTRWRRKFVHTTDSRHELPVAGNVLARRFTPARPNEAWVSDMTYIRTRSGWLYLAVVLDLFSRKIVGWAMAPSMPAELVCAALSMAIASRMPAAGLLVHSDRGSQYASEAHTSLLKRHGLVCSMSRKGNCWDTYLPSQVRGQHFYLYLFEDLFSRKIVGWQVFDSESAELASQLLLDICARQGIRPSNVTRAQAQQQAITVRVIDYELPGLDDAQPRYRLMTTLSDPQLAPAMELAAVYHQRWEIESVFDELKTHLRQSRRVLRSKTPELVRQEFYGWVLAHYAVRWLLHQGASSHRIPHAELSFKGHVELLRRTQPHSGAFPPSDTQKTTTLVP